jgi:predicted anti-sigma-YlaC factor YlaD
MNPRPGGWRHRWILLLAFLTPPCRRIVALGSRDLDGAAAPWDRWRIRVHRSICTGCRRYLQQLEVLRTAAQRSADQAPPSTRLSIESRDRLKRRLRCEPAQN